MIDFQRQRAGQCQFGQSLELERATRGTGSNFHRRARRFLDQKRYARVGQTNAQFIRLPRLNSQKRPHIRGCSPQRGGIAINHAFDRKITGKLDKPWKRRNHISQRHSLKIRLQIQRSTDVAHCDCAHDGFADAVDFQRSHSTQSQL